MESSLTTNLLQMHTIANIASTSSPLNSSTSLEDDTMVQCPTCEIKLHRYEVAKHCDQEMKRLQELQTNNIVESCTQTGSECSKSSVEAGRSSSNAPEKSKPWTVFQRVQRNRQSRMKQRNRKRSSVPEHPCPVCNLQYPQDEIQQHADECLRRSRRTSNGRRNSDEHSSDEEEDIGVGEQYEEYEWAGQKRIRVSSLIQGGYAAIGIGQPQANGSSGSAGNRLNGHIDDDDEDLNVDEDDTQIYGPTQYGENDVIPSHIHNEDESDVTSYMRRLITGSTNSQLNPNVENTGDNLNSSEYSATSSETAVITDHDPNPQTETAVQLSTPAHYQQIIDSLKVRLRHYEEQHVPGKYKCLICLDDYRNPAISVACWHVHCEQCWLRSLGARKLCPQCNLITTPKDLRRIYM